MDPKKCTATDCDRNARSSSSAYCEMHYYRLRRTGTVELRPRPPRQPRPARPRTPRVKREPQPCVIEGCDKTGTRNSMCSMHAARVERHGDPSFVMHQKDRNLPRGEKNHKWTGSDATYNAIHQRLSHTKGAASTHQCADCGGEAQHWSYDHRDPDERTSETGLPYSVDLSHYAPRCTSCHKQHDYDELRRKGTLLKKPRCGKPMEARTGSSRRSEINLAPVCGQAEGHGGPCRSAESYARSLTAERNRRERNGAAA